MSSNLGFSKHIFFYLIHKVKGIILIPNPIGWKEGNKTTKREDDHSITVEIGNSLEYYNIALDLIKEIRRTYGTDEDLELLCEVRDSDSTTKRRVAYRGFLDLSTFEEKDNKGTVKFRENTLEKTLKSSKSQKIELEREETLIDTVAEPLETKDILIKGRSLFLESKLVAAIDNDSNPDPTLRIPYEFDLQNTRTTSGSGTIYTRIAYPLDIKFSSHLEDVTSCPSDSVGGGIVKSASGGGQYVVPLANASFFTVSEFDRTLNINFDLYFDVDHISSDEFGSDTFFVILRQHSLLDTELDGHIDPETVLFERVYTSDNYNQSLHIAKELTVEIKKGDTLSLHVAYKSNLGKDAGDEFSRVNIAFKDSTITISEDNKTPEQTRKTIRAYDFGKKIIELITGNANHFYAPILDTGIWKDLTLSSGLWIRGFYGEDYGKDESEVANPNDVQIIKASLSDFINFCDAKLAVGVSFKIIDGIEKICFEPLKDKYKSRILITLDKQPYDFGRKVKSDLLYTGCKFGDKFADIDDDEDLYEEIYGMSEFNTLSEWSTEYYKNENIYEKISEYRTDGIGKTLALKKSLEFYPNTDTRFDESIFVFHVKDIDAAILEERNWEGYFAEAPKNVYSPDDATNLLFTPKQMFLRHSFLFNTEIKKSIKYLSGRGNNSISTRNNDNVVVEENTDVKISDTLRQLFYAEEISFSYPYDKDIIKQISGQTTVNGVEVLNVHGLVRFKNEKGEYEQGFVSEIKEDSKIEFKIIAVNPISTADGTEYIPDPNIKAFSDEFSDEFN
ncbi:structural protein [Polaribacter phage Danklef_3]|nr:structural protein [Polaribacter phage Danklef_3]